MISETWEEWPYEVFICNGKIVLVGEPSETHSCDQMGCTSIYCVVARAEVYLSDKNFVKLAAALKELK